MAKGKIEKYWSIGTNIATYYEKIFDLCEVILKNKVTKIDLQNKKIIGSEFDKHFEEIEWFDKSDTYRKNIINIGIGLDIFKIEFLDTDLFEIELIEQFKNYFKNKENDLSSKKKIISDYAYEELIKTKNNRYEELMNLVFNMLKQTDAYNIEEIRTLNDVLTDEQKEELNEFQTFDNEFEFKYTLLNLNYSNF